MCIYAIYCLIHSPKDIKNVLCTCYVCTAESPSGCKVTKATKRSHSLRYGSNSEHKKITGETQFKDFTSTKQFLRLQSTAPATQLTVLDSILQPPQIDTLYQFEYYPEANRSVDAPDPSVSYASPEFIMDALCTAEVDSGDSMLNEPLADNTTGLDYPMEEVPSDDIQPEEQDDTDSGEIDFMADRIQSPSEDEQLEDDFDNTYDEPIQFRFEVPEPPLPASDTISAASDSWSWSIVLLLTTWAHVAYHVPVRVLEVFMKVLKGIFIIRGDLCDAAEAPISLKTSFKWLGLEDNFLIMPMCIICRRIFADDDLTSNSVCPHCDKPLFKKYIDNVGSSKNRRVPNLQFPFRSLSSQLPEFLNREGVEAALDAWRSVGSDGSLRDVMDGKIWKSLKDHNGGLFFDNDPKRGNKDELRIGITLGFDG